MEIVICFFKDKLIELGYEAREGQEDMAFDIVEAMRDKQHIVIEAGVGIGKSYAYLVPLLLYNKSFGQPVLISTSSIALQEQLMEDIVKISKLLDCNPDVVLAKGKRHFACIKKALDYLDENVRKINYCKEIIKSIEDGIIDRVKLPIVSNRDWQMINADDCRSQSCEHKSKCKYIEYREKMKITSGVILTNHDMLTINMDKKRLYERELFNEDIKFIVIDEAHNLEDKVRSILTKSWKLNRIKSNILNLKKAINYYSYPDIEKDVNSLIEIFELTFINMNTQIDLQIKENDIDNSDRYTLDIQSITNTFNLAGSLLEGYLFTIGTHSNASNEMFDESFNELENLKQFIKELISKDTNWLYWLNRNGIGIGRVSLEYCPKRVNEKIEELYFSNPYIRTILTSATIAHKKGDSDEDSYSYFIRNTNFPSIENKGFLSTPKESPFPYDEHSIIYNCDKLPKYNDDREGFIKDGTNMIVRLAEITNGKTLILFTSKRDMEEVYNNLIGLDLTWNIFKQDGNSSQSETLESFRMDTNSILLGTGAFWEGISIEGESLSSVVIFRLPFPVPDPIINYKCDISDDRMKDVLLPHMIIKLKQGIGRLIRNYTDTGIVAILDPRLGDISGSSYKDVVWDALPIKNRTSDLNDIADFYNTTCIIN